MTVKNTTKKEDSTTQLADPATLLEQAVATSWRYVSRKDAWIIRPRALGVAIVVHPLGWLTLASGLPSVGQSCHGLTRTLAVAFHASPLERFIGAHCIWVVNCWVALKYKTYCWTNSLQGIHQWRAHLSAVFVRRSPVLLHIEAHADQQIWRTTTIARANHRTVVRLGHGMRRWWWI